MLRMIGASLRRRAGRALALLLGVLVATTGFTVLTGSTDTARLQVTELVEENLRGSYDILVRPAGARTAVEDQRGLVQPNFLGGQYGGITADQWRRVQDVPGVEVAAPIAMLGYAHTEAQVEVDVTDAVDPAATRQLIEVTPHWHADQGLTEAVDRVSALVYVTTRPVAWPVEEPVIDFAALAGDLEYSDGLHRPASHSCYEGVENFGLPYEIQEDGTALPLCSPYRDEHRPDLLLRFGRAQPAVAHLAPDGTFVTGPDETSDRLTVVVTVPMPLLVAAIDPVAEADLVGLDRAVVDGRYLEADEAPMPFEAPSWLPNAIGGPVPPALVTSEPVFGEQVSLVVHRVGAGQDIPLAGRRDTEIEELVAGLPVAPTGWTSSPVNIGDGYQPQLWQGPDGEGGVAVVLEVLRQVGPIDYEVTPEGTLRPRSHPPASESWAAPEDSPAGVLDAMPWLARDTAFRTVLPLPEEEVLGDLYFYPATVGVFDPALVGGREGLGRVPLETYVARSAEAGDDESRQLLGGGPLLPNSNVGGYLTTSPSVLLALSTVLEGLERAMPAGTTDPPLISAVRVRVAGVTGVDDVSRERVRVVAERIATATGLDVDIVLGSSFAPQEVELPAGQFGRPELRLADLWSLKGVAVAIIEAVDRKSVMLFGLVLVVCVLFLANAAGAAVRDRRRELAVLACLGWSRWRLGATIGGEVALVGLVAGALAAGLAPLLGDLTGVEVTFRHSWQAVPVALGLAVVAALVPAWRASRAHPGAAVQPAVVRPRARLRQGAGRGARSVVAMAAGNLARVPGRTLLGVLALAVGVAGLTVLAAVTWVFHGTVTGSLVGDAVSLQVRGVDAVAVAATLLLGLVAVADVLYVNVRERAAELAALRATGWSGAAVGRLVTYEGLGIGFLGAVLGAGAGLAGAAWFAGALPPLLVAVAAGAAAGGVALAGLAALVPATLQYRIPVAGLLAEE